MRKERGGQALNRFLATWERLHSGSETTPTATPTSKPKRTSISKRQAQRQEEEVTQKKTSTQPPPMEEEDIMTNDKDDDDDIVDDFNFSSSDSD